jgi:hypothetical protein
VLAVAGGLWLALGASGDDPGPAATTTTARMASPTTRPTAEPTTVPTTVVPTTGAPVTTTTVAPAVVRQTAASAYAAGSGCATGFAYEFVLQGRTVTLASIGGSAVPGSPSGAVADDGVFFLGYQTPGGVTSTLSGRIFTTSVNGTAKQGDCIYTFSGKPA